MAGQTTVLTEFADNGNSRTYTYAGHSALAPRLVIQKRKVPTQGATVAEMTTTVVSSTTDAEGLPLGTKPSFSVTVRYPANGQDSDVTAALAVFRDIIAGDEFGASVLTQGWLK